MAGKKLRPEEKYVLRLYVADNTPQSAIAYGNLKKLCQLHLAGRYILEVIELVTDPARAKADRILAVPTLVRKLPKPIRKFIGNLADTARVLIDFDVQSLSLAPSQPGKAATNVC